jgi:hypothetical protein
MNLTLEEQLIICPKCRYQRKSTDAGPAGQCPCCGVVYDKYFRHQNELARHAHDGPKKHPGDDNWRRYHWYFLADVTRKEKLLLLSASLLTVAVIFLLKLTGIIAWDFKKTLAGFYFWMMTGWLIYRVFDALNTGSLYRRGRFSRYGNWYHRESDPVMFWQIIVIWLLGIAASATVFVLIVTGMLM